MRPQDSFITKKYAARLEVVDRHGLDAWFTRRQVIQAQEDGVVNFIDRVWGDGVVLASYVAVGMRIVDSVRDQRGYTILLRLKRQLAQGEEIEIETRRRVVGAFHDPESYWELAMPGPTKRFTFDLIAPAGLRIRLPRISAPSFDGVDATEDRRHIRIQAENPEPYIPYRLDWSW